MESILIIIGLTGLHRAGKSFFRNSQIPQLYGYNTVNKKELIINLCKKFSFITINYKIFNVKII